MTEYIVAMRRKLRLKSEGLDDDIEAAVNSALLDMKRSGAQVSEDDLDNALVFPCVEFYCKWMMNFEAEGEKYEIAYEKLRDSLSLSRKESYEDNQQEAGGAKR